MSGIFLSFWTPTVLGYLFWLLGKSQQQLTDAFRPASTTSYSSSSSTSASPCLQQNVKPPSTSSSVHAPQSLQQEQHQHSPQPGIAQPPSSCQQPQQCRRPTLDEICAAPWTTMLHIPPDIRDEWSDIFWDCLSAFLAKPSVPTFADVFLCSKCLLAIVRHGGKQRAEAVSRTVRARITMWRAGKIPEIWERLQRDHKQRTPAQQRDEEKQLQREAQRVARMVDQGLLSRAASQLGSRGLAPRSPETKAAVEKTFPAWTASAPAC